MSVADLKKYGQMLAEKPEVRANAKEIGMTNLEGQVAYAKTLGLEFTTEDMVDLAKEAGVTKKELSEEELEKVAGGFITLTMSVSAAVASAAVGVAIGAASAAVGGAALGIAVGSEASRNW